MIGAHVPPPAGLKSPAMWGDEAYVSRSVRQFASQPPFSVSGRLFNFRYRSAAHWLQVFRDYYGPTHKAFGALDVDGAAASLRVTSPRCSRS